jgi:hypothetical protein
MKMMKTILAAWIVGMAAHTVDAQSRNANWISASGNWLDFNTASPPTLVTGSSATGRLTSCMSSTSGQLLFYTDDSGIKNALHQTMSNNPTVYPLLWPNNLPGNTNQGRLVIPRPGELGHYIVFFNGSRAGDPLFKLEYAEVDMNMDGGLGAWVDSTLTLVVDSTRRAMSGTRHANGTDYWVVVPKRFKAQFLAYQVSSTGVSTTPVISTVGSSDTVDYGGFFEVYETGSLTFNLAANRFVHSLSPPNSFVDGRVELFNFDQATGTASYYTSLDSLQQVLGMAFSPDGSKLYVQDRYGLPSPCLPCNQWSLWQYDISDPDPLVISASKTLLIEGSPEGGQVNEHSMSMGPDGKIYVHLSAYPPYDDKLGTITYPNLAGAACMFDPLGFQCAAGGPWSVPNQILLYHDSEPIWLGVQELKAIPTLSAFPNPVTEELRIVPPAGANITGLRWLDATGREVRRDPVFYGTGIITAARGSLAPGAYLVQALNGQRTVGQVRVVVP